MENQIPVLPEETILALLNKTAEEDRPTLEQILLKHLPLEEQDDYRAVISGERLPSFMSDVIAKKLFDAEMHKDRLEYLLQQTTGNLEIKVSGSTKSEGYIQSLGAKKVIFDLPVKLLDNRLGDLEFQVSAQNFVFRRGELYGSDLLMLQYGVESGEKKGKLDYENVQGVILVMLMRHSPEAFRKFASDRYIHRFNRHKADSGLSYEPLVSMTYVQLDKCLEQFNRDIDGEKNSRMQLMLSLLADPNNPKVLEKAEKESIMSDMIHEVRNMVQSKEVQAMLLAEKYAVADMNAIKKEGEITGGNKMLYELVSEGNLPVSVAAAKANVSEEVFRNNLITCGYKLPD